MTNWYKESAVREERDKLAKGVGAYALILGFDWNRGERVVGKLSR